MTRGVWSRLPTATGGLEWRARSVTEAVGWLGRAPGPSLWYAIPMMRTIIITGGLGSGKSTAAERFAAKGAVVVSADELAHEVLAPGSMTLAEVREAFGDVVIAADGSLDRAALAALAFASDEATARLNAIVHPAVYLATLALLRDMGHLRSQPPAVILDVPLLDEAPQLTELADLVVAIQAPEDVRLARAVVRGMDPEDARARIARQATDARRAALADVVVDNTGTMADFERVLDGFWSRYVEAPAGAR